MRIKTLRKKPKYTYVQSFQWQIKANKKWKDIEGETNSTYALKGNEKVRVNIIYTKTKKP
jgi:TRAP-type mannitol/chloroaromatic compound transport system permease small subunit